MKCAPNGNRKAEAAMMEQPMNATFRNGKVPLPRNEVLHLYGLYGRGYSVNELAEIFGIGWHRIWTGFVRFGLKRRAPHGHSRASRRPLWDQGIRPRVLTPAEIERARAEFLKIPKGHVGVLGLPERIVQAMYADYINSGELLIATARKWNRSAGSLAGIFAKRALRLPDPKRRARILARQRVAGTGCFARMKRATPAEMDAIIARQTKVAIPSELRWEFRTWPLGKRFAFIRKLRAYLNLPTDRPKTPFSKGLLPFDYTTPEARAIKDKLNAGLTSREAVCKIDLCSQGVIYKGELYFWSFKSRGYFKRGVWTPDGKRPSLHHVIWEEHHGRKVPQGYVLRFGDGNKNNHAVSNLVLVPRNEVCRENQATTLFEKARAVTALLLERSQRKEKEHGHTATIQLLKAA